MFNFLQKLRRNKETDIDTVGLDTVKTAESSNETVDTRALVPKEFRTSISDEVLSLLWFVNGPFQNYESSYEEFVIREGNILFKTTIRSSFDTEPSSIDVELPIIKPKLFDDVNKMPYYPSYSQMDPYQRYVYLSWLKNPYQPIDLGYVYVFYYGLERHLLFGNFEDAFDMTIRLLNSHKISYAYNALVLSSLFRKKHDKLKQFMDTKHFNSKNVAFDILLLLKYTLKISLTANEIIDNVKEVGFTNKRYIKNEPKLFYNTLIKNISGKYNQDNIPIHGYKMIRKVYTDQVAYSNYSLSSEERIIKLPSILGSTNLSSDIYNLLSDTHEEVKIQLRELRKKRKK